MVGKDETGVEVFQTSYFIKEVNVPLDETIFVMKESSADYKTIHIADALLSSINPDETELPPFQN